MLIAFEISRSGNEDKILEVRIIKYHFKRLLAKVHLMCNKDSMPHAVLEKMTFVKVFQPSA